MHLRGRCSALGPGPGSLPRPGLPQVQARERGRVPCSHRIWSLATLHSIPGRRGYSGGEWVHPWGWLYIYIFIYFFEGNTTTFLISRTILRGFFAIPTRHRRNSFVTSEGLLSFETRSSGVNRTYLYDRAAGRWSLVAGRWSWSRTGLAVGCSRAVGSCVASWIWAAPGLFAHWRM
jgi:hypothetical protein